MKKNILISTIGIVLLLGTLVFTANYKKSKLKKKNVFALNKAEAKLANKCCGIWKITIEYSWTGPTITCNTGGDYQCEDCACPENYFDPGQ